MTHYRRFTKNVILADETEKNHHLGGSYLFDLKPPPVENLGREKGIFVALRRFGPSITGSNLHSEKKTELKVVFSSTNRHMDMDLTL